MWSCVRVRGSQSALLKGSSLSLLKHERKPITTILGKACNGEKCKPRTQFQHVQSAFLSSSTDKLWNSKQKLPDGTPRPKRKKKSELLRGRTYRVLQSPDVHWDRRDWEIAENALFAWTRQPVISTESVELSFALLDRMIVETERSLQVEGTDTVPPYFVSTKHINIVLDRWRIGARQPGPIVSPKKWSAALVFDRMENYVSRLATCGPDTFLPFRLDVKSYAMIMAVSIRQDQQGSLSFCTNVVNQMKESPLAPSPNHAILTYLMDAHIQARSKRVGYEVQAIFDFMVKQHERQRVGGDHPESATSERNVFTPNEKALTRVMQAWILTPSASIEHAQAQMKGSLAALVDLAAQQGQREGLPNSFFLNLVLDFCNRHTSDKRSVVLAHYLVRSVLDCAEEFPFLSPDADAFEKVISLWLTSELPDGVEKAEKWLHTMHSSMMRNGVVRRKSTHSKKDGNVRNANAFHRVLDAMLRAKDNSTTAGKRAEILVLKMQELSETGHPFRPSFKTFERVMKCWLKSRQPAAVTRAADILRLSESLAEEGDVTMRSNADFLRILVEAWSHSRLPHAPMEIEKLMRLTQERREVGKETLDSDGGFHAALIRAHAFSGHENAAAMAQKVFDECNTSAKSIDLYNALILAQGGDTTTAELILQDLLQFAMEDGDGIEPTTETFNNVISSWSKSGSPMAAWRADGIFNRMIELHDSKNLDVAPNSDTFDLVITILANEWGSEATRKVDEYLERLKKMHLSGTLAPGATAYTEAIRAWGSNTEDPRAVLRATALLEEMSVLAHKEGTDSVKPDRNTYSVYLQALSRSAYCEKAELASNALVQMQTNDVVLDRDLLSQVHRCSLPSDLLPLSWPLSLSEPNEFPLQLSPPRQSSM